MASPSREGTKTELAPCWNSVAERKADMDKTGKPDGRVRVLLLGCFDVMHSGHYNALRQAKQTGDMLVAGVHSGESILANKGPPVMDDEERMTAAAACKWVDEVVGYIPYEVNVKLLDDLGVDYCVHGDDLPTNLNGNMYQEVILAGRCKIIRRTEGVSSTDLLGRMLSLSQAHLHQNPAPGVNGGLSGESSPQRKIASSFLATSRRIAQFADRHFIPDPTKTVVYLDGAFDLFHVGHMETLMQARCLGDVLLVGIHDDATINEHKGANYPIMSLHERVFNVLSCRFVDDVIIGAPWEITQDMITSMNVKIVAAGSLLKQAKSLDPEQDPYGIPKALGMFRIVNRSREITSETFIQRVISNFEKYKKKSEERGKKEQEYLENRVFIAEK
eukprot:GILJ01023798.1.p1 GENE.GILJ01023798.1~~GILJ01023798.1.p1  ORF type:complete len:389 (+),score=55.41 GILJ01023798.1:79-1245(+)